MIDKNCLKGTVSPGCICLKVVWLNRPRLRHVTRDKFFFLTPFNFEWAFEVLRLNAYQSSFLLGGG
jgi:hypothetical protein